MKILQVTSFFKPSWEAGGIARVSYELSKRLAEKNEVVIYTTDGFKSRLKIQKNQPIQVDNMSVYYFRNLSNYLASKNICIPYLLPFKVAREVQQFDIIHIHWFRSILAVLIWYYAKKHDIPYILQAHGSVLSISQKQSFKNIFDQFFGFKLLRDASKVIALTNIEADQYKTMGVNKNKIKIIPNGIDITAYSHLPERGEFRRKYSIKNHEKIILYLGRLHKIKGVDLLIQSFADLSKEMNNIRLVIVGPDDGFLSELKRKIDDLNINDKTLLTGPLYGADKFRAYVDADVYVLPSVYETFPITVLEASAFSKPVIVTNRCGIADFVEKYGYVIEYDRDQLHDAIAKFLNNKKYGRISGERGRNLVKKEFNWDNIVKKIERIYEDCT